MIEDIWKVEISGLGSRLHLRHEEKDDSEAFVLGPLTLMEEEVLGGDR